jgi:hypothetical protein
MEDLQKINQVGQRSKKIQQSPAKNDSTGKKQNIDVAAY